MKTYWRYQQDDSFTPLGVADSVEGAVESLRYFLADNSGTMPVPIEEPEIAAEVKGHAVYLTVLDSDFPRSRRTSVPNAATGDRRGFKQVSIESRITVLHRRAIGIFLSNSHHWLALFIIDKALELSSQIEGGSMNKKDLLLLKARTLIKTRKFYEAELCFREVIKINEYDSLIWSAYAQVFIELKDFDKVVDCYYKALELKPERKDVLYAISQHLHFKLNRSEEALTNLDRYLKIVKDDPKAWILRGQIFSDLENHENAAICFEVATSLDPNNIKAWYHKGFGHLNNIKEFYNKGLEDLILKEATLAINCFERIVDSNVYPKDEILALIGFSYYHLGDYTLAQEKCEQALLLNQDIELAKNTLLKIK